MQSKVGITGTRYGWTEAQHDKFRACIRANFFWIKEFHHGLCEGVDALSHGIVFCDHKEIVIIGHPSVDKTHQLECVCDELREEKTHFARNRDIVNETDALIVIPAQMEWQPRGGTWYTHDYAVKQKKPVLIIWPDGSVQTKPADRK